MPRWTLPRPLHHPVPFVPILLVASLLLLIACTPLETGRPVSPTEPLPTSPIPGVGIPPGSSPEGLGSDAELNKLAEACFQGALNNCDALLFASEPGSPYEQYAATCGGRNDPVGNCVELYGPPLVENTAPRIREPEGSTTGELTAVRMAGHAGFDRFVLEFTGTGIPGYDVRYVDERVLEVPNDKPIEGEFLLIITITPATTSSFRDVLRLRSDTTNVIEGALVEDGLDQMTWALALLDMTGFEVVTLTDPSRVVVDVAHP